MFDVTIKNMLEGVWPMLFIVLTIIVSLRITYLILNKPKFELYQELFMLLFIVYILCLFYVVTFQDVNWATSNYIPFKEMFRYKFGTRLFFKNVLGNLIMFLPYGFFVSYFLRSKKSYIILILSIITSSTIEFTQAMIGRVFDVDDIILNVFGAMFGFLIYKFVVYIKDKLPDFLKNKILYNIIILIFIALMLVYLWNFLKLGEFVNGKI